MYNKEFLDLHNKLEDIGRKFRCPTNKKMRKEFELKVEEIKKRILLIIKD